MTGFTNEIPTNEGVYKVRYNSNDRRKTSIVEVRKCNTSFVVNLPGDEECPLEPYPLNTLHNFMTNAEWLFTSDLVLQ